MGRTGRIIAYWAGILGSTVAMILASFSQTLPDWARVVVVSLLLVFVLIAAFAWRFVSFHVRELRKLQTAGLDILDRLQKAKEDTVATPDNDALKAWKDDVSNELSVHYKQRDVSTWRSSGANEPWTVFGSRTFDRQRVVHDLEKHLTSMQAILDRWS